MHMSGVLIEHWHDLQQAPNIVCQNCNIMLQLSLDNNVNIVEHQVKVKVEGVVSTYVDILYGIKLDFIFDKKSDLF
jgi:hypothetical protein